ncbi:MAG: glycosyltransferase family 4 protein [Pirellulaceae bacterium]|nr:glycosyltransferase family 4 protein [Pirellulaceae bacterium]
MKILFISPVGFIGGAERVLLECVRQVRLLRPDWDVTVVMFADGELREAVTKLGASVEVVALPEELAAAGDSRFVARRGESADNAGGSRDEETAANAGGSLGDGNSEIRYGRIRRFFVTNFTAIGFFWKFRRALKRIQPDLIHSNGLKSHLCLSAVQYRRCPILWHIHDYFSHRPKIQRMVRLASRRARGCFCISSSIQNDIQNVAPNLKAHLLENCVDTDHFSPGDGDIEKLDRLAGFAEPTSMLRVGLVATYANWKGHELFLQAIAKLPNTRAYIVGGPLYTTSGSQWSETDLRGIANKLGIQDRVGFVPFQTDPRSIYRSLDIVVHASTRPEPFGLTIAEAMACGRPVVVANAGGARDLFTDQKDAVGHEPGNIESLKQAIEQLASNPELREKIGRQARATAAQRFTTSRFGSQLIEVYESLRRS